mgnify:CR=1 FL=1
MNDLELTAFECQVLEWLLAGRDPVLGSLRAQLAAATIVSHEQTGHGFYLQFAVPECVTRVHEQFGTKPDFCFGDIEASIHALEHGAGFVLWIREGALDLLEGYTYEEAWPACVRDFRLCYLNSGERDIDQLRKRWKK